MGTEDMIYTDLIKKAMILSYESHRGQYDKGGLPYIFHPFHLAEQMSTEETVVIALLHDVIEDTEYTIQDIADMGFPQVVLDALMCLTHDKAVPYMDYISKIKQNPLARVVKLADLQHNSDVSRLNSVDEETVQRIQKYKKAIALLSE